MPFPILPILAGLASATGIGAGAYGIGTSVRDRNAQKKSAKKQQEAAAKYQKQMQQNMIKNGQTNPQAMQGNQGGFQPSAQPNSFWGGQPAGAETYNQYTPQQQQGMSQVLQQALSGLGNNQFDFGPIEDQARRGFNEQTIPSIAERFSSLGAQKSSSFPQILGAAGAGLETDLAAMKQNYGLQQQQMLHNLLGVGLKPQFESIYRPGSEGFGKNALQNLLGNLATGDNLMAGAKGFAGLFNRNKKPQEPLDYTTPQQQAPFSYTQNPTTFGGSMAGIYNPGNITGGMKAPATPYIPQIPKGGAMSNVQALKGLYGI